VINTPNLGGLAQRIREALEAKDKESDARLVEELIEPRRQEAARSQRDQERLWRENIAFIESIQWLHTVEDRLINTAGRTRRGRVRLTDNRLGDYARRLHARLQQVRYAPSVVADTDDPGDQKAAKAAHGALRWFYRRRKVAQEKRLADWWIVATGQCYLEAYYDPDAGPRMPLPVVRKDEQGQTVVGPDGAPELEMEPAIGEGGVPLMDEERIPGPPDPLTGEPTTQVRTVPRMRPKITMQPIGEVDFVVRSPFQVKRDPRFQDWRQLRWIIVEEVVAVEDVIARYGRAVPDLEERLGKGTKPQQPLPWIPEPSVDTKDITGLPRPPRSVSGTVTLVRYYERPSGKRPNGLHVVYVDEMTDLILHKGDLDTPDRDFPIVPLMYLDRPWVLEGRSPVGEGKPLQRLYNRIISRYGEHLVRLSTGWILVPTNSGIPRNAFTNEIGSIIRHTPGSGMPTFVFPPFGQGLAWYDRFLERLEGSMEERMALPPAARGIMPKGARAARTVELLQEAADAVQAPVLAGIADGWVSFYEKILGLMHRHYTIPRLVAMQGPSKVAEVMEFKGADLPRDWRDRLTVSVEVGESLPSSRTARMELILTLARVHGLFGPPGTTGYIRGLKRALDLEDFVSSDEDLDVTIAEQENYAMLHGAGILPIREFDDDWVHLGEHIGFAKRLVAAGREADAAPHLAHAKLHFAQWTSKQAGPAGGSLPQTQAQGPARTPPLSPSAGPSREAAESVGTVAGEAEAPGLEGPPPPPSPGSPAPAGNAETPPEERGAL